MSGKLVVIALAMNLKGSVVLVERPPLVPGSAATGKFDLIGDEVTIKAGDVEFPMKAVQRACLDQTGVACSEWKRVAAMYGKDWTGLVYVARDNRFNTVAQSPGKIVFASRERFDQMDREGLLHDGVAVLYRHALMERRPDMRWYM